MSVTVRERDREREWDSRSFHEDRPRGSVTVRRYKVPDREEDERVATASRYSRRETLASPRHSEFRDTSNVREYRYERDVETDRPRDRDLWEYRSERARSPPRDDYREIRIEREVSREPPRRERARDDYELDHYTKTVDYYGREPRDSPQPIIIRNDAPQPIIIREQAPQPIIIREERPRSPRSEMVREREREEERHTEVDRRTEVDRKTEVNEERSVAVVKRESSPPPQEDEYYYQRTTREIARRDRDDYDDYKSQRDLRSRDSASQYNRRNERNEEEDYYYRREEYDTGHDRARSKSRHRLHLAEGAIAGVGAAALLNRHRKKEGERSGGVKNLVGGALVGTAATEIASRARSRFGGSRSRSRSGSPERDRGRRRRDRDHSQSRSRSHSKDGGPFGIGHMSNLGKLAGVAAIGALAGYAASRRGKNKDEERRSRSRVRQSSRSRSRDVSVESAHDRKHRNSNIAKAGLASAAVAGVVERVRSRSRGARSKSRLRTGAPIAAAGIGGAALAGLYERHKAKKEERDVHERRSYSRSRSRSAMPAGAAEGAYAARDMPPNDQNLIEYGEDPIGPGDAYHRPGSRAESHYGEYAARRRSSSGSASPRRRRYASRSRSGDRAAEAAAGAGIAGVAAHEASQRRERKRAERQRRREEEAGAQSSPGATGYGFGPYGQEPPPMPVPAQQAEYPPQAHEQYYQPEGAYAPPNAYSPMPQFVGAGPPGAPPNGYDAHGFAAQQPPAPAPAGYGYQNQGPQYPPNNVSVPFVSPEEASMDVSEGTGERSVPPPAPSPPVEAVPAEEDAAREMHGPRRASKSVAFDLRLNSDNPHHSPNISPRSLPVDSDGSGDFDGATSRPASTELPDKGHGHGRWRVAEDEGSPEHGHDRTAARNLDGQKRRDQGRGHYDRAGQDADGIREQQGEGERSNRWPGWEGKGRRGRNRSQTLPQPSQRGRGSGGGGHDSDDSSETISLPDRFDSEGRKKPESGDNPLSERMEEMLHGRSAAGRLFQRFAQDLMQPRHRRNQ